MVCIDHFYVCNATYKDNLASFHRRRFRYLAKFFRKPAAVGSLAQATAGSLRKLIRSSGFACFYRLLRIYMLRKCQTTTPGFPEKHVSDFLSSVVVDRLARFLGLFTFS